MAVEQKVRAEQSESVAQRLRMLAVARELAVKTSQLVGDEQRELAGLLALQAFRLQQANGGDPADLRHDGCGIETLYLVDIFS